MPSDFIERAREMAGRPPPGRLADWWHAWHTLNLTTGQIAAQFPVSAERSTSKTLVSKWLRLAGARVLPGPKRQMAD